MKENFLILTFLGDSLEADSLKVDFLNKNIDILSQEKIKLSTPIILKKILSKSFYPQSYKLILNFDSKTAFTNYEAVSFLRDNPQRPIDEADLENLISQALWRVFDKGRAMSAKQLGLDDLENLLIDTKVHDFKIDERRVISPLKHKGKKIDILISQTFVSRPIFSQITKIMPRRANLVLAVESGIAASKLLPKINRRRNFIYAKINDARTDLFFTKQGSRPAFLDYFNWGKNHFYVAIANDLKMPLGLAEVIIEKFIEKDASEIFLRRFDRIFSREIAILIKALRYASHKAKTDFIFLDFPPLISSEVFPKIISPINTAKITDYLGFRHKNKKQLDFLSLAGLMEFYFSPKEDLLNRLAKRRMRWLTAK